jgi:hypothetical protein
MVASLAYVAVAAAYGARALDAVVTPMNLTDSRQIAVYGALVIAAGVGLLALRGLYVLRPLFGVRAFGWLGDPVTQCIVVAVIALGSIAAAQAWESHYLAKANVNVRGQSVRDLLLVAAARKQQAEGSELATRAATPGGRALLALRILTTGQITDQTEDQQSAAERAVRSLVAQKIGTPAQVFDNMFVPSVRSVRDAFNAYVTAQEQLADAIRGIPQQQADAWDRYTASLAAQGLSPTRVAPRDWPAALGDAKQAGAPVTADWNPGDKAQFAAGVGRRLADAAQADYAARVSGLLGAMLPPGLTWEQFVFEPLIQARWSTALGVPGAALSPELTLADFSQRVYSAMVARLAQPIAALISDPGQDPEAMVAVLEWHFAPARAFCAVLLLVAALGALAFSDILALAGLPRSVRAPVAAVAVAAVCFAWYGPFVVNADVRAGASLLPLPAPLTVTVMEVAPIVHGIGEAVRNSVLNQFGFGWKDADEREAGLGFAPLDRLLSRPEALSRGARRVAGRRGYAFGGRSCTTRAEAGAGSSADGAGAASRTLFAAGPISAST